MKYVLETTTAPARWATADYNPATGRLAIQLTANPRLRYAWDTFEDADARRAHCEAVLGTSLQVVHTEAPSPILQPIRASH
jgi:hypothetical protein